MNLMSNEFTQQVSDIVVYGKEEANRLQNDHIEPEHLLLGILRDGECKAAITPCRFGQTLPSWPISD